MRMKMGVEGLARVGEKVLRGKGPNFQTKLHIDEQIENHTELQNCAVKQMPKRQQRCL